MSFVVMPVPGHSPAPSRLLRRRRALLRRRPLRRIRRPHRPSGSRLGHARGVDRLVAGRLSTGNRRPSRPRATDDARRRARGEPVPRSAARVSDGTVSGKIERPRGTHDVVPAEMPLWGRVTDEVERLCALYGYRKILTPVFEDTALFARTSGQGSDVVQKEMYSFTDRSDRPLTLRPEGTAPICRAYVEHGMHRDPQPVKMFTIAPMYRYGAPGKGRYREHWQASVEAIGSDDPSIDAELIQLYDTLLHRLGVIGLPPRAQLDRLPRVPSRLPRDAPRLARGQRAPARRRYAGQGRDEPAARLRQLPREARGRPRSPRRGAEDRRVAVRGVRRAFRRRAGRPRRDRRRVHPRSDPRPRASTTTRARPGSSSARWTTRTRRSRAAAATTGSSRRSAGRRRPASDSVPVSSACSSRWRTRASPAKRPTIDVFFALEQGAPRHEVARWLAELRRGGVAADTDYAGRSLKGQLTQAARLGAAATVIVGPDGAVLRRHGHADEPLALADVVGRLSG